MINKKIEPGYYWIKFCGDTTETIGRHDGSNTLPWEIIASDELFREDEIIVLRKVK